MDSFKGTQKNSVRYPLLNLKPDEVTEERSGMAGRFGDDSNGRGLKEFFRDTPEWKEGVVVMSMSICDVSRAGIIT